MTTEARSDALVLFGATGDLAYEQIFPALQAMCRRNRLTVPVVCVARPSWTIDQLRARVEQSVREHGVFEPDVFDTLASRLRYVAGDYQNPATFTALRAELGSAERPLFYLAIPPSLFTTVASGLARAGCDTGARLIVEKPFGRSLESAKALNATLRASFPESAVYRIDHFLGKEPVQNLLYFRAANVFVEPIWNAAHVAGLQITMAEAFGVRGRGRFYEEVGAIRDVLQNHLLQVLALLTMELPTTDAGEAIEAAKVDLLRAIRPLRPEDVVRGQYRHYQTEPGVALDSRVETYVAARLRIDNPRWNGVPIGIRAGKGLASTVTEVRIRFKRAARGAFDVTAGPANEICFRLSPDVSISLTARVKASGEEMVGEDAALVEHRAPGDDMRPYERLIGDALRGDRDLFGSEAGVEAAWQIVDPILKQNTPLYPYDSGSWGPAEARAIARDQDGWIQPIVSRPS